METKEDFPTTATVAGAKATPQIDVTEHVGKWARIERVEEFMGQYGPCFMPVTEALANIETPDKTIEIRARRTYSLKHDPEKNELSWSEGGATDTFLKEHNVNHWNELVGKKVQVQRNTNKDGKVFLTF